MQTASISREPTTAARALLEGKPTSRSFMKGRPVVKPDGKPALHQSVIRPNSSDPYGDLMQCAFSQKATRGESDEVIL